MPIGKLLLRAAVVAVGILVAASATTAQQLTTIRFIATSSDDLVPFWYAQSAGLFKAAGLDVQVTTVNTGAIVTQAIIGGAADIGRSSPSILLAAHVRGIPFVILAPGAVHRHGEISNAAIVVTPTSPIKSLLDLQGKTVSCTAIGDFGYLGLRALIDAQGGDSSTVKWIEIPVSAVAPALEQGRIDAGLSVEPFMTRDVSAGKIRFLVDMINGYPGSVLQGAYFSMRAWAQANPDAVARFARVMHQASVYTNSHVAETAPLVVANTGLDQDVVAKMHRTTMALTLDPGQVQPLIDVAAKYKSIPQGFDAREMFWPSPR
ncbi:MAG TPA: ABC transporter substrate-binding protein [Candidatus Lustribacter sp.]|jgi:NitT/TauT family transport system substrate-binding protein|nr:ABC transporter substrate-binding protein [Candidatus Lustribacter sp.]